MPTKQTPQEYKVNTTLGEAVVRPCCTKFDCTTLIVQLVKKTKSGADGGNRTRDLILTKNVLYHLSYVGLGTSVCSSPAHPRDIVWVSSTSSA